MSFLEGFPFALKCLILGFGRISFTAVMILSLLMLAAYLSMLFTSSGREFGEFRFLIKTKSLLLHVLPRAKACIESDGGAFEYKLKSLRKDLIVNFFIADIFSPNVQH